MKRFVLALLILVLNALPAPAALSVSMSQELLFLECDCLVVAVVEEVVPVAGSDADFQLRLKVTETLKGPKAPQELVVRFHLYYDSRRDEVMGLVGHELIAILYKEEAGQVPAWQLGNFTWLDLSAPSPTLEVMVHHQVVGRSAILDEVRDMVAAAGNAKTEHHSVPKIDRQPPRKPIPGQPWLPGSTSVVIVPINRRLERFAKEWLRSDDPERRIDGVQALKHFKNDENIDLLKGLGGDPEVYEATRMRQRIPYFPIHLILGDEYQVRHYPVRAEILKVLQGWGIKDDRIVIDEPTQQVPFAVMFGGLAVLSLLLVGWRWRARRKIVQG